MTHRHPLLPLARALLAYFFGAATLSAGARCVQAQKQPVLFVHGLNSDGSIWQPAADSLRTLLPILGLRPSLSKKDTYLQQALSLKQFAQSQSGGPLPDTTIAIGHSNGGIVSREAARNGLRLRGLVTVGSPQLGAPLVDHLFDLSVGDAGAWLANNLSEPYRYYRQFNDSWPWIIAGNLANWLYNTAYYFPEATVAAIAVSGQDQLLGQMMTTSPVLAGTGSLNGPSNLSTEAATIATRVQVTGQVADPWLGSLWWALTPNSWAQNTSAQIALYFALMDTFEYYYNYWNLNDPDAYAKRAGAYLWLNAAGVVPWINGEWCWLIGAYSWPPGCVSHDGIVPVSRQLYPGNTFSHQIPDVAHHFEPSRFSGSPGGFNGLRSDFGLQECSSLGPFSVPISGTPANLGVGYAATLSAQVLNLCDQPVSGYAITWTSANTSLATVNSSGVVTGQGVGYATITASASGKSGSTTIRVTATNHPLLTNVIAIGPTQTVRNCPTTWDVSATGGAPPLTYKWSINGVQKQNGAPTQYTYTPTTAGSFSLVLTATDSRGDVKSTPTITVSVAANGTCPAAAPRPTR